MKGRKESLLSIQGIREGIIRDRLLTIDFNYGEETRAHDDGRAT